MLHHTLRHIPQAPTFTHYTNQTPQHTHIPTLITSDIQYPQLYIHALTHILVHNLIPLTILALTPDYSLTQLQTYHMIRNNAIPMTTRLLSQTLTTFAQHTQRTSLYTYIHTLIHTVEVTSTSAATTLKRRLQSTAWITIAVVTILILALEAILHVVKSPRHLWSRGKKL